MLKEMVLATGVFALATTALSSQPSLQSGVPRDPRTAAEWIAEGDRWYQIRSYGRALGAYQTAGRLAPLDVNSLLRLAVSANELGRFADALAAADAVLKMSPNMAKAHNERGYAQKGLGDGQPPGSAGEKARYDAALASYRQAIRLDPSFGPAHRSLADLLYLLGARDEAIPAYVEAVRLDPEDVEARFSLGVLLADARRNGEAAEQFVQVVRLDSRHYEARGSLATMFLRLDRIPDALEQLRLAFEIKPDYGDNHARLAIIHAAQKNGPAALGEYRIAESLDPKSVQGVAAVLEKAGIKVTAPPAARATAGACPTVITTGPAYVRPGQPAEFAAVVKGAAPGAALAFNWSASAGTLSSGQGTDSITVDTPAIDAVTALVHVGGLPKGCVGSSAIRTIVLGRRLNY